MNTALGYIKQGVSIVPIPHKEKSPSIPWKEYQSRVATEEEVKMWFKDKQQNVGIVTGEVSGITVVDVDVDKGGRESIVKLGISSPITALSSRGFHLYYKYCPDDRIKTVVGVLPGIDIRSEGGIIVAPPSIHASGKRYMWRDTLPFNKMRLPDFPLDKFNLFTTERTLTGRINKPGWVSDVLNDLKTGQRHQQFSKIIGKLNSQGWEVIEILTLLTPHAKECNFNLTELENQIKSMCVRYSDQRPVGYNMSPTGTVTETVDESYNVSSFLQLEDKAEWIVDKMIANNTIGFFSGLQQSCKTWVLMDLAIESAITDGMWLGKFPTKKCKVLYIDQERFKGETKRRFQGLIKSKNIGLNELDENLVLKCGTSIRIDLPNSFNAFRKELERIKPKLVLIDSMATFHTSEDSSRTDMQNVMEKIKSLRTEFGCTFIFIEHENKGVYWKEAEGVAPTAEDTIGSVAKTNASETVFTFRKVTNQSSMIYHTKSTMSTIREPFIIKVTDLVDGSIQVVAELPEKELK